MAKPESPKPPTEAPADAEPQAEATHTSADGTVCVATWWRWPRRSHTSAAQRRVIIAYLEDGTVWVTTEATAAENPPTEAE